MATRRIPDEQTMEAAREALAARMAQLRSEAGMSQRAAATRAGMDQRNWSRIERRELNPRLDSLLRIQFALGVESLESLFGVPATGRLLERD
jgi:transcriptional regulator with XRE-family HTH domain